MIRVLFLTLIFAKVALPTIAKRTDATNVALLVSYGIGQPKIAEEFEIIKRVVKHPWVNFNPLILEDEEATRENILKVSETVSRMAGKAGTLLFAFDGWSVGTGQTGEDRIIINGYWLPVKDVFDAFLRGRKDLGPLARFVFLFIGDKTYKNLEKYAQAEFYKEFIGLGMEQEYLIAHEAFETALLKVGLDNGSMEDFKLEVEERGKADKTRLLYHPNEIKLEKLRP